MTFSFQVHRFIIILRPYDDGSEPGIREARDASDFLGDPGTSGPADRWDWLMVQ